jgi:serine/threonine protein kinase
LVKVGDFGISRYYQGNEKFLTKRRGTCKYIAKEVEFGEMYDERCDIFSLGIIFY